MAEILAPSRSTATVRPPWRGQPGERKPLWAILGGNPPANWKAPSHEQVSSPKPKKHRPKQELSVTGHPVFPGGPIHTALQYKPDFGQAEWISAGPNLRTGHLVSGAGSESSLEEIRPTDRPENNSFVGEIKAPMNLDAASYWDVLKSLDSRYGDDIDYDLFPEIQNSYNSNSYTRGLLEASNGTTTAPYDRLIGGPSPLPARYFASPHLRDSAFPASLKPQPIPTFRRRR